MPSSPWEQYGFTGTGNAEVDNWFRFFLDDIQTNPGEYGLDPTALTPDLWSDLINHWNALDPQVQQDNSLANPREFYQQNVLNYTPPEGSDRPPWMPDDWQNVDWEGAGLDMSSQHTGYFVSIMQELLRQGKDPNGPIIQDWINRWNQMDDQGKDAFTQMDVGQNMSNQFDQIYADYENRAANPPPPPPDDQQRTGQPVAEGDQWWMRKWANALRRWEQGGRQGPRPNQADYKAGGKFDPATQRQQRDDATTNVPGSNSGGGQTDDDEVKEPVVPGGGGRMTGQPGGGIKGVWTPWDGTSTPPVSTVNPKPNTPSVSTVNPKPTETTGGNVGKYGKLGRGGTPGIYNPGGGAEDPAKAITPTDTGGGTRIQQQTSQFTRPGENSAPGFKKPLKRKKQPTYGGL